jgi:hypothetical protein
MSTRYDGIATDVYLKNFQVRAVPLNTRINPLILHPEQFTDGSYANTNMKLTSYANPFPQIQTSSSPYNAVPHHYGGSQMSFMNPLASSFPGNPNANA